MRRTLIGAAMLLALGASPGLPAAPLQPNQAGSCTLGGGVALAIKAALLVANSGQKLNLDTKSININSIVIRFAANPNGGQRLAGNPAAYTGAIVCTFDLGLLPRRFRTRSSPPQLQHRSTKSTCLPRRSTPGSHTHAMLTARRKTCSASARATTITVSASSRKARADNAPGSIRGCDGT